jgi:ribosomal protein S18 acetylase RimI-like enzyme
MNNLDKKSYLDLARSTGAFKESELKVLLEVLDEHSQGPDAGYILFEEKAEDKLIAFAIMGETPLTKFGWDIYWLVVGADFQGRGLGRALIKKMEEFAVRKCGRAVLRVETSGHALYDRARRFYRAAGFHQAGRIADFYASGDDLVLFAKDLAGLVK